MIVTRGAEPREVARPARGGTRTVAVLYETRHPWVLSTHGTTAPSLRTVNSANNDDSGRLAALDDHFDGAEEDRWQSALEALPPRPAHTVNTTTTTTTTTTTIIKNATICEPLTYPAEAHRRRSAAELFAEALLGGVEPNPGPPKDAANKPKPPLPVTTAADVAAVAAHFGLSSAEAAKLPPPGPRDLACWQHGNPTGCWKANDGLCKFVHIGEAGSNLAKAAAALSRGRFDTAVSRGGPIGAPPQATPATTPKQKPAPKATGGKNPPSSHPGGAQNTNPRRDDAPLQAQGVRVLSWNVQTLNDDKIIAILTEAKSLKCDVVALQEVGFKWQAHFDALFATHGFAVMAKQQREDQKGGGAMIAVRNGLRARKWTPAAVPEGLDVAAIHACIDGTQVGVMSLYWPPAMGKAKKICQPEAFATWLAQVDNEKVIIAGDFNARHLAWCAKAPSADMHTAKRGKIIAESRWRVGNIQPGVPTYVTRETTPDLVLCGRSIYGGAGVPPSFVGDRATKVSDHRPLLGHYAHDFVPLLAALPTKHEPPRVRWTTQNIIKFARHLNGQRLFRRRRTARANATTHRRLVAAINRALAAVRGLPRTKRSARPGRCTRRGRRMRRLTMKRFIRKAPNHVALPLLLGRLATTPPALLGTNEDEMRDALLDATRKLHASPAPDQRTAQAAPGPVEDVAAPNGELEGVAASPQPPPPPPPPPTPATPPPQDAPATQRIPRVTRDEVLAALRRHPKGKAADDDGITAHTLAAMTHAPRAVEFIRQMADDALRRGVVPQQWRQATTVPLLKPGKDATKATSYRPVAITSYVSRTIERVVLHRMLPSLDGLRAGKHVKQMAYLSGTSTRKMTAELLEDVQRRIEKKNASGYALLFDFSSAFCRVTTAKCAAAFDRLRMPSYLTAWTTTWMSGRRTRIRLPASGTATNWTALDRGCPQGSVLGPFIWLATIESLRHTLDEMATSNNAAIRQVTMRATVFADDLSVFVVGAAGTKQGGTGCRSNRQDSNNGVRAQAQEIYRAVVRWAEDHDIEVSSKTTAHMLHPASRPPDTLAQPIAATTRSGKVHTLVPITESFKNLGMMFTHDLTQGAHAAMLTAELESMAAALGTLRRFGRHPAANVEAYMAYGLSKVRYGAMPHMMGATALQSLEQAHTAACRAAVGLQATTDAAMTTRAAGLRRLVDILEEQDGHVAHVEELRYTEDRSIKAKGRLHADRRYAAHAELAPLIVYRPDATQKKCNLTDSEQYDASQRAIHAAVTDMLSTSTEPRLRVVLATDGSVEGHCGSATQPGRKSAAAWVVLSGLTTTTKDAQRAIDEEGETPRATTTEHTGQPQGHDEDQQPRPPERLAQGCIAVNPNATSFSAEAVAGARGLEAALALPLQKDQQGIDILWISDSRSLFDRLDCTGPVLDDDDLTTDIHSVRAAHPSARIFAVHVYSHCGVAENEAADELAQAAEGRSASWWKDDWRVKRQALRDAQDAKVTTTFSERQRHPQRPSKMVTAIEAKWIAQLKCGVCAALGGNLHGEAEDCYNCGAPEALQRGGVAVRHMFACSAMDEVRRSVLGEKIADDIDASIGTLWTAPSKAIAYARRFWENRPTKPRYDEGESEPDTEATAEESDDSDWANGDDGSGSDTEGDATFLDILHGMAGLTLDAPPPTPNAQGRAT